MMTITTTMMIMTTILMLMWSITIMITMDGWVRNTNTTYVQGYGSIFYAIITTHIYYDHGSKMVDEATKRNLAQIPLLKTKAGPRDGEIWVNRLKEEYQSLIQVKRYFPCFSRFHEKLKNMSPAHYTSVVDRKTPCRNTHKSF